ncbi:MAG: ATP-binding protein [Chthoniobacteraceae bacterium]
MSFPLSERLRTTLGWRITVWYAVFFVAGFIGLLLIVQLELDRSLRQMDSELVRTKFAQMRDELNEGGLKELRKLCEQKDSGDFFVRVADPKNHSIFVSPADGSDPEDIALLEERSASRPGTHFSLMVPSGAPYDFESAAVKDYVLQVGYSSATREGILLRFKETWAYIMLPTVGISIMLGAFFASRMLRPLRELNAAVRHIVQTGIITERLDIHPSSSDEIGGLIASFNDMMHRLENLMTAMKGTLDNVAHDLRTPLTRLRGIAELALRENDPESARAALAECLEEGERVTTLLNTFMDISEAENGAMNLKMQAVNVAELVEVITEIYSIVAEEKQQQITTNIPADLTLYADPSRIHQAVANLVDNALKYTPEQGRVDISAQSQGGEIVLTVSDTGTGIAPEELTRIWERLYRGDKSRSQRGLGLGLSFVKAIVEAHKGRVELTSAPGAGSRFILHLPAAVHSTVASQPIVAKL